jgi:hypothetical protein
MAIITQAEAVQLINRLTGAAETVIGLKDTLGPLIEEWTNGQAGAVLNSLPTVALNADGTFGAPDGSQVPGDPIDPTKVLGLSRATNPPTPFNVGVLFNILQQFMNLVNGSAVTTEATAAPILDSFRP